jgi:hypothetical protein
LYQAQPDTSLKILRERAKRRVGQQDELVISPEFFVAFQQQSPKVSSVEIRPKLGRFDNEMTRFRFDAILHVGTDKEEGVDINWLDGSEQEISIDALAEILQAGQPEIVGIRGIRNARVEKDVEAVAAISSSEPTATAGELKRALSEKPVRGISPGELRALAVALKYEAGFSWTLGSINGSFDVILRRSGGNPRLARVIACWPKVLSLREELATYTNEPSRATRHRKVISDLQKYLMRELPGDVDPPPIVLLEVIPRSPDGQVDTSSLPQSTRG